MREMQEKGKNVETDPTISHALQRTAHLFADGENGVEQGRSLLLRQVPAGQWHKAFNTKYSSSNEPEQEVFHRLLQIV